VIDDEPAVRLRIACPARVRALWRHALELASRVAGAQLAAWRAAEIIAAEGFAGRPPGASIADRALLVCTRLAHQARRSATRAASAPASVSPSASCASAGAAAPERSGNADFVPSDQGVTAVAPAAPLPIAADPFALDAQLVAAMRAICTSEPRIGRLLRVIVDQHLYRALGFPSVDTYLRERLGISVRRCDNTSAEGGRPALAAGVGG
jgi:hypothetical protein